MLESLSKHVRASTAISLSSLTLTRIACAGVLLDASGKLKLFDNAGIEGTKFIMSELLAFVGKEAM
jgi:Kinetochore complex Sim4 subunit Fta1